MPTVSDSEKLLAQVIREMRDIAPLLSILQSLEKEFQKRTRQFQSAERHLKAIKAADDFDAETYPYRDLNTRIAELRARLRTVDDSLVHTRRRINRVEDQTRHCEKFFELR